VAGGAKKVFACECSPTMIEIAQKVIQENDTKEKIVLITKHSNDLKIPQDLPSRYNIYRKKIALNL